jgi:hypothetical protein
MTPPWNPSFRREKLAGCPFTADFNYTTRAIGAQYSTRFHGLA